MVDIGKQIHYWVEGAKEDWEVAQELLSKGRVRHGLFLGHLALEKILKAHVCRTTQDLAPRIHNLIRIAELAGFNLSSDQYGYFGGIECLQRRGALSGNAPSPSKRLRRGTISGPGQGGF